MSHSTLITSPAEFETWCSQAKAHARLAIDTEFVRESTYFPQLCLLQLATEMLPPVAVDMLEVTDLSMFFSLLEQKNLVKILHSAEQDMEALISLGAPIAAPLYDTQIAARYAGYGEQIGYEGLVKQVLGKDINKAERRSDWSARPLREAQLHYALADVEHLVDLYNALERELVEKNRKHWMLEDERPCTVERYITNSTDSWRRIRPRPNNPKVLGRLQMLAAWREQSARALNVPRGWVITDELLLKLAERPPKNLVMLANHPAIITQKRPKSASHIGVWLEEQLEALFVIIQSAPSAVVIPTTNATLPVEREPLKDLLRAHLRLCAMELGLPPSLIASSDELHMLASGAYDAASLVCLQGWRAEIFGASALEIAGGRRSVSFTAG